MAGRATGERDGGERRLVSRCDLVERLQYRRPSTVEVGTGGLRAAFDHDPILNSHHALCSH